MLEPFYPSERAASVWQIPYEALWKQGYRGILYDIDNTLVPHGTPATAEAAELFGYLHEMGFQTCLISNNQTERVQPFAEKVDSPFLCDAHKPSRKGYLLAAANMGLKRSQVLFVGDQIFTDIWGANRAGIRSILVNPIHPKEEIQIVLKRIPEKLILFCYRHTKRSGKNDLFLMHHFQSSKKNS